MSMITSTTWVPRGRPSRFPQQFDISDEDAAEMERLADMHIAEAKAQADEASGEKKAAKKADEAKKVDLNDAALKEFDLENYSDSDEEQDGLFGLFGNAKSLAYHNSNDEDPYITLKDGEVSDEERQELEILPTDSLILATSTSLEDGLAHLEVYVYEDDAANLYLHHDIPLSDIPLAVEWLGFTPSKPAEGNPGGSFAAVATMGPDIELWNLDVPDAPWPTAILGQSDPRDITLAALATKGSATSKKAKSKKKTAPNGTHHVSSVLALAANRAHPHLLASGSADTTVKLWDLTTATCAHSYGFHSAKVSSLAWHPTETTLLLSGSCDPSVALSDLRAPGTGPRRWAVAADVEVVAWNPADPNEFVAATDSGLVYAFDVRAAAAPKWTLHAHDGGLTALHFSAAVPGLLATGSSEDKTVKVWSVPVAGAGAGAGAGAAGPTNVLTRSLDLGPIFGTAFPSDSQIGTRLAVAGSKGERALQVWDLATNPAVRAAFGDRIGEAALQARAGREEVLVGVASDGESESDDEDGDGEDGVESHGEEEEGGDDDEMRD